MKDSESQAMREYALEQGIPDEDIIMEAQSTNTLENMKFSKEIMERENRVAITQSLLQITTTF